MSTLALPTFDGCYSLERDPDTPIWGIVFLSLSNLAFLLPAIAAYRVRAYFITAISINLLLVSSFYHICKPLNGWCLLPYVLLYNFDFFHAFMFIPIVFNWYLPFQYPLLRIYNSITDLDLEHGKAAVSPPPSPQSASPTSPMPNIVYFNYRPIVTDTGIVGKDIILYVFYGLLIAILIGMDFLNFYGYLILTGVCFVVTASIFLYIYLRFRVLPIFLWPYMFAGLGLLVLGAVTFGIQPFLLDILKTNSDPLNAYAIIYSVIHSIWHIASGVAQFFFIRMRMYKRDPLDAVTTTPSDTDLLQEIQILNIVHDQYKTPRLVQERVTLKNRQKLSPWTFYTDDYTYHPSTYTLLRPPSDKKLF